MRTNEPRMPTDEQRKRFEEWEQTEAAAFLDDPDHCNYSLAEAVWLHAWLARDAEVQALERVALNVMASLDAALSILGRSHEGKVPANEAVASDRMFTMMLDDYQKSLDAARAALAGGEEGEAE